MSDRFMVLKKNKQWRAEDLNLVDSNVQLDLSRRHETQEEQRARDNYRRFELEQAEQSRQAKQTISDLLYTACEPERLIVESALNDYETARQHWQEAQDRLDSHTAARPSEASLVREWSQEQAILDNEVSAFYDIASEKLAALEQAQQYLENAKRLKLDMLKAEAYSKLQNVQREAQIEISTIEARLVAVRNKWQNEAQQHLDRLHLLGGRLDSFGRLLETVPIVEK